MACYFMMTTLTTVGYGDFLGGPTNVPEMAMICIIMLLGTGLFAYIMGSVNSGVEDYNALRSDGDKMGELNIFLDQTEILHGSIPGSMKAEIYKHFIHYWKNDRLKQLAKAYWQ